MPLAELKSKIQELSKIDKLRLMQFLATELVKEEDATNFFVADREYPVWSPYNCSDESAIDKTHPKIPMKTTIEIDNSLINTAWRDRCNCLPSVSQGT
jgi:hypothetical protein